MTYRSRLLLYVGMLIVLLLGMMTLSFKAARDVIVEGAEDRLRHATLRKQDRVLAEREELRHYTQIITGDLRLQEYLYIITELGTSSEGLASYYERQFGSLPTDYRLIMTGDGEVLLGEDFLRLASEVRRHLVPGSPGHFYFRSEHGVVMVVTASVLYQGQRLATAAVARVMDQAWLARQERRSRDYLLLFEEDGKVLWSSNVLYRGQPVDLKDNTVQEGEQLMRLSSIPLEGAAADVPRLWFGISETRLIKMLESYQRWVYSFAVLAALAVLLVGWLMVRNFGRPFAQLMEITEQMIHGKLPVMPRSESRTEMDRLVNRFADVLDALRREQAKVERAHRKLQETAITDSLTGLYNRRYLQEIVTGLFAQVVRDERYLTAVLLDLDYFKAINDCHGHLGGDAVLVHFARLLKHNSRANDHLFRIGGEEFLILNVTEDPAASAVLANKIRELVSASPANYQGVEIPITVSAGVSCCPGKSAEGEATLSQLMRAADKALYEAKSNGRNQVVQHGSCREAAASVRRPGHIMLVSSRPAGNSES
ncbi:MAG TPA: GGDEF domain-containing protein [Gammaproteobacteria bacterium]|nr:GGDEF domain-containing protein [Gammaproteobacteria bacterium]